MRIGYFFSSLTCFSIIMLHLLEAQPYYVMDSGGYYLSDWETIKNSSNHYSQADYNSNSPYYSRQMQGGYRRPGGTISYGSSLDYSEDFSGGVSSYQGTSTGPGPNGGYPGAPRGVYQTHYVDTSIYPNTYMQVQFPRGQN